MDFLKRGKVLKDFADNGGGPVVYWMSRDQRVHDNWALLAAQDYALTKGLPLFVVFCLNDKFLNAGVRQFGFMLRGLKELQQELAVYNIPFVLLRGEPGIVLPEYIKKNEISYIFTDFDPLRIKLSWKKDVLERSDIPFLILMLIILSHAEQYLISRNLLLILFVLK